MKKAILLAVAVAAIMVPAAFAAAPAQRAGAPMGMFAAGGKGYRDAH